MSLRDRKQTQHVRMCPVCAQAKHLVLGGYSRMLYVVDVNTADVVAAFDAHETRYVLGNAGMLLACF